MKIKTFYLNSTKEIIVKIVKEILVLFKVEINDADDTIFDYDELKIENIYDDVALNGVKTVLTLRKDEKLWTRRLREKLELDPANPEYIRTKWGVGYYLSSQGSSSGSSGR